MPKKGVSDLISCHGDVGYSSLQDDTQGEGPLTISFHLQQLIERVRISINSFTPSVATLGITCTRLGTAAG